jgi:hypothetical protein
MLLQLMEVPAFCLRCTQWAVAAVKPTIRLLQPRETLLLASVCGCGQWKMEDEEERRQQQQQQDEARNNAISIYRWLPLELNVSGLIITRLSSPHAVAASLLAKRHLRLEAGSQCSALLLPSSILPLPGPPWLHTSPQKH